MAGLIQIPEFVQAEPGDGLGLDFIGTYGMPSLLTLPIDAEKRAFNFGLVASQGPHSGGISPTGNGWGVLGQSWKLDGSTGFVAGQAGNLPNSSSMVIAFRASALSGQQTIFGFFDGVNAGKLVTLETNSTTLTCNARFPGNSYLTVGTIAVNQWHVAEIVFQWDGSALWRTLYLDGVQVQPRTFIAGTFPALPYFCIGRNYAWTSFQQFFNGYVAFAAMFPSLHSSAQASSLYQSLLTGEPYSLFEPRMSQRMMVNVASAPAAGGLLLRRRRAAAA